MTCGGAWPWLGPPHATTRTDTACRTRHSKATATALHRLLRVCEGKASVFTASDWGRLRPASAAPAGISTQRLLCAPCSGGPAAPLL
jgi:hypothetical protein